MKRMVNCPILRRPHSFLAISRVLRRQIWQLLPGLSLIVTQTGVAQDPSKLPLVKESDIEYLGDFRMPNTGGEHRLGFGGNALGYNPLRNSLYVGCHAWYQELAEVSIPTPKKSSDYNSLPSATILQSCADVTDGKLGSGAGDTLSGNLVYNGRRITTSYIWYDGSCSQRTSHGVSPDASPLANKEDFQGFYAMTGSAGVRAKAGYMTVIPVAWQARFGGPALTGLGGGSIIGCLSSGPAATVFDPDDVGVKNPIPGKTVLNYPDPESNLAKELFFWTTTPRIRGVAFPEGTSSVLFFGSQGDQTGPYNNCYGIGTGRPSNKTQEEEFKKLHGQQVPNEGKGVIYCYDPCGTDKGTHSYPYKARVWSYDANELVKVITDGKDPTLIRPHDIWDLHEFGECASVSSATYDPKSSTLYLAPGYGESPKIMTYRINVKASEPSQPEPPTNVRLSTAPGK